MYDQQASVVIDSDYDADVVVVSCTCRMIKDKITRSGTLAVHHLACIPLCCGMIADTGILAAKSVIVRPCNKSTTVQTIGTHRSTALAALCGHGHRTSPAVIPADCIGLAAPEIADFSDQAARCCHDGNTFFTDIAACLGTHKSFGCRNDCTELSAFCGRVFLQYSCLLFICTVKCYVILNRQCTVFFCICFCHFFCFC